MTSVVDKMGKVSRDAQILVMRCERFTMVGLTGGIGRQKKN